jgi:cell division protein FtsI (penicillin-binding protein 3)
MKKSSSKRWLTLRITTVFCGFILLLAIIILRAFQLQIIEKDRLTQLVEKQYLRYVDLSPKRGTIYDRKKRELAISIEVDSAYARPGKIKNKKEIAKKLSPILNTSYRNLKNKLASDSPFVWLKRKISPSQAKKIKDLNLEGIGFIEESKRFYPNKELASHCLGFADLDLKGLEGIELNYESYLKGKPGYILVERDALGRNIHTQNIKQVDTTKGYNLQLTIDKTIQYFVEKALEEGVQKSRAKAGVAIVMVPQTGEILALAVHPTFNPNNFWDYSPSQWRNRAVTDSFEPGSTFKIFLISSALEEGIFQPQDIFYCENGSYPLGNRVIHDVHKYGWLTLTKIIKHSSNIGACKIAENLGRETFYSYIRKFGFGGKTGIDLPGETSGLLTLPYKWSRIRLGTISFGQGLSIPPIQLITALSAIANGGVLMKPYLVKTIFDDKGKIIKEFHPEERGRVISQRTARQVTSILKTVVEKGGTGVNASIPGFKIAGKTGTAQKVDQLTKQYSDHKTTSSFIGFLPADEPKLAVLVIIDEPEGISYGGTVAAPVFKEAASHIIRYLNIPPNKGCMTMVKYLPDINVHQEESAIKHTYFKKVSLNEQSISNSVPNFSGLSMRDVLRMAEELDLNIEISGSGKATDQYPPPGNIIKSDRRCWVRFQSLS